MNEESLKIFFIVRPKYIKVILIMYRKQNVAHFISFGCDFKLILPTENYKVSGGEGENEI